LIFDTAVEDWPTLPKESWDELANLTLIIGEFSINGSL
jgi:hypothetical protein